MKVVNPTDHAVFTEGVLYEPGVPEDADEEAPGIAEALEAGVLVEHKGTTKTDGGKK
jgi:hypothetical protein